MVHMVNIKSFNMVAIALPYCIGLVNDTYSVAIEW